MKQEEKHLLTNSFWWQYSRNVSQTRWIIDDERMGDASVEVGTFFFFKCYNPFNFCLLVWNSKVEPEGLCSCLQELIGSEILPVCQGDNYKFHAAGREDIDVCLRSLLKI